MLTEVIGILGSVLVLISMMSKTNTYDGALKLRIVNLLGSIVFIVYGVMLPAYSTIALNIVCTIVNLYYLCTLKRDYSEISDYDEWEDFK